MKKRRLLHLTLDNSKSDKGQGDYYDQIKKDVFILPQNFFAP